MSILYVYVYIYIYIPGRCSVLARVEAPHVVGHDCCRVQKEWPRIVLYRCVYVCIYIYICMYVYVCIIYMYIYIYMHIHIYIQYIIHYIYIYIYVYVYIYIYIYTYDIYEMATRALHNWATARVAVG